MNEKKISLTTAILLFIIILLIMVIIGGGVYCKIYNKQEENEIKQNYVENEKEENNKEESKKDVDKSVEELVTDAKFNYNTGIDSFTYTWNNKTYTYEANSTEIVWINLEKTKFPYINIDSQDAKEMNKEIEDLFNKYFEATVNEIKIVRDSEKIENEEEREQARYNNEWASVFPDYYEDSFLQYSAYKNDNILSIVIKEGKFVNVGYKYKTYNIDLNTGKKVKLKEAYPKLGYTQSELEEKLLEEVAKLVKERCEASNALDRYEYLMDNNKKTVINTIESDNASYFIDENKNLNIVLVTDQTWGNDLWDILYTVRK